MKLLHAGQITVKGKRYWLMVTALIPGEPLDRMVANGPLQHAVVAKIGAGIARAIDAWWTPHQIVHRDLKPSNVIVRPDGSSCVIDLGVARHTAATTLTAVGSTWGTRGYFSPEQARALKQLTCKSDVFALGVVMLESLLGRHPTGGDQALLLNSGFEGQLPPGAAVFPHEGLLRRMLSTRPTRRPDPAEVVTVLSSKARS